MTSVLIIGIIMLVIIFLAFGLFVIGFMVVEMITSLSRRLKAPSMRTEEGKKEMKAPEQPPEREQIGKEVISDDAERIRKQRNFERLRKYADDRIEKDQRRIESGGPTTTYEGDNVGRNNVSDATPRKYEPSLGLNRPEHKYDGTHKKRIAFNRFDD